MGPAETESGVAERFFARRAALAALGVFEVAAARGEPLAAEEEGAGRLGALDPLREDAEAGADASAEDVLEEALADASLVSAAATPKPEVRAAATQAAAATEPYVPTLAAR